jgi:hypothetical protein
VQIISENLIIYQSFRDLFNLISTWVSPSYPSLAPLATKRKRKLLPGLILHWNAWPIPPPAAWNLTLKPQVHAPGRTLKPLQLLSLNKKLHQSAVRVVHRSDGFGLDYFTRSMLLLSYCFTPWVPVSFSPGEDSMISCTGRLGSWHKMHGSGLSSPQSGTQDFNLLARAYNIFSLFQ